MKRITLFAFLLASAFLSHAQSFRSADLLGSWKITDVKYSGNNKENARCYLCDLYEHEKALVFTADGKVSYEDNMNPDEVYWKLDGNKLFFSTSRPNVISTPEGDQASKSNTNVNIELTASMQNGSLILVLHHDKVTETYTLNK